ncbi:unnamed protein product [Prorocentrum cordatum]|uniref:Uncharacterized protein n=1 Tax=Prorocentrum cordatum TaxID=2364126 RepID=A0ABN9X0S8_9DINO|nr:unnamed protein product [Polarella glacialis]
MPTSAPAGNVVEAQKADRQALKNQMKTLLGSVDGSIMLDRFWEKFDAGPLHLQWFLDEACTKPSIVPSPHNRPISETVVEEYKCRILNSGLSTGTRAFACTYNHLSQAFYRAHEEQPNNICVQAALKNGLKCRMINEEAPDFSLSWICDFHNHYHGGSKPTFWQAIHKALAWESRWHAYCHKWGIVATGNPSYELQHEEFVTEIIDGEKDSPIKMASWRHFVNTKSVAHKWENFGVFEVFEKWCIKHVNFLNDDLHSFQAINVLHAWALKVVGVLGKFYSKEIAGAMLLEGLKLCVPMPERKDGQKLRDMQRKLPWLFKQLGQHTLNMFDLLNTPIAGATAGRKVASARSQAVARAIAEHAQKMEEANARATHDAQAAAGPEEEPPLKMQRRGKGRGRGRGRGNLGKSAPPSPQDNGEPALPAGVVCAAEELVAIVTPLTGNAAVGRPATVLDDVIHAVEHSLGKDHDEKVAWRTRCEAYSIFLQFCFAEEVSMNGKAFNVYSKLREDLQSMVSLATRRATGTFGTTDCDNKSSEDDPGAVAQRILDICLKPVEITIGDDIEHEDDVSSADAERMFEAQEIEIRTFLNENANTHPTLQKNCSDMARELSMLGYEMDIQYACVAIGNVMDKYLPCKMIESVAAISVIASRLGRVPAFAEAVFPNVESLESFISTRVMYTLHGVKTLAEFGKLKADDQANPMLKLLQQHFIIKKDALSMLPMRLLCGIEASASSTNWPSDWVGIWQRVFKLEAEEALTEYCQDFVNGKSAAKRPESSGAGAVDAAEAEAEAKGDGATPAAGDCDTLAPNPDQQQPPAAEQAEQTQTQTVATKKVYFKMSDVHNFSKMGASPNDSEDAKQLTIANVDGLLIKSIETSLNHYLWVRYRTHGCVHGKSAFVTSGPKVEEIFAPIESEGPCAGFQSLIFDVDAEKKANTLYFVVPRSDGLGDGVKQCSIMYAGAVSATMKGASSFLLATVFGVNFYLNHPGGSMVAADFPAFAWHVKAEAKADKATLYNVSDEVEVHMDVDGYLFDDREEAGGKE